jgi:hypothetical protein
MEEFRIAVVQTKEKKSPVTYNNVNHKWRKELYVEQCNSNERNGLA